MMPGWTSRMHEKLRDDRAKHEQEKKNRFNRPFFITSAGQPREITAGEKESEANGRDTPRQTDARLLILDVRAMMPP